MRKRTMEKGHSEENKIRSAIKEKLKEINGFGDDLLKYIMLLLANQRSKVQFENELSIFLGDDTGNFINWLWDLLNNLNCTKSIKSPVLKDKSDPSDTNEDAGTFYFVKTESKLSAKVRESVSNQNSKNISSSETVSVKRKNSNTKDQYDLTKAELKKTCNSNTGNHKVPFQANKLLQKAVNDAAKSTLNVKNFKKFHKSTTIKVLSPKLLRKSNDNSQKKTISVHQELTSNASGASKFHANECVLDFLVKENYQSSKTSHTVSSKHIPVTSNISSLVRIKYSYPKDIKSPVFIVTLNGISRIVFKKELEENNVDYNYHNYYNYHNMEEPPAIESVSTLKKKLKLTERCKYWPACKNEEQCLYHHPTDACKCFPDCKFGDKCLYIHPNCKYDAVCRKKDCPFTHASQHVNKSFQS